MKVSALNDGGAGLVYRGSLVFRRDSLGMLSFESALIAAGRITAGGVRYHVTDHLGSVRAVVDGATGDIVEVSDYAAYGERLEAVLPDNFEPVVTPVDGYSFRYHFTGQEDQGPVSITVAPNASAAAVPYTDFGARHYSPVLRRWLVPDPLSEKYYDVSPYAYCAGDPVNYVDPNGATLYIGMYRYDEGLLYDIDNFIMDLDDLDEFTRSAYDALQALSASKTGRSMISDLEMSDFNFVIRHGNKSQFQADNGGEASGFGNQERLPEEMKQMIILGSGGTVYWNEEGSPLLTTAGETISPSTDLGHELSHAQDAAFGLQDNRVFLGLPKNEWQAVYNENLIRRDLHLPLRTYYYTILYPDGTRVGISPIMIKRGKPIRPNWY